VVRAARDVPTGVRYDLEIASSAERVPAILVIPHSDAPVSAALLLHGFGSRKERMADTIGEALVRRGVAALSVDLPLHGSRDGSPHDLASANPMKMLGTWSNAVAEARLGLAFLATHPSVAADRLAIVGYSLGSFLANIVAAGSPNVRAVVLAASGDLPEGLPFESLVRAVVDPLRAVRLLAGRPLLMVNGRFDRTVKASQAERLFAAAHEPKTMRWYGGGHWPPAQEIEWAAAWVARKVKEPEQALRNA
jgi:fermentation-respiration switch protein FrsA (DUF1100 family)